MCFSYCEEVHQVNNQQKLQIKPIPRRLWAAMSVHDLPTLNNTAVAFI